MPDSTGLYDGKKLVALLDRIPSMDTGERTSLDVVLTWMTSLCLCCTSGWASLQR